MLEYLTVQTAGLATVVMAIGLIKWRRSKQDTTEKLREQNPPPDTVLLHQYGAAAHSAPSISPFVIKLETYLRAAKIPYQNRYDRQPGPRGKLPWIQFNDQIVSDSQLCIRFLNRQFHVDLNKSLGPEQLAVGHLMRRIAEESLYWALVMFRLVVETTGLVYRKCGVPSPFIWYIRRQAQTGLWWQGYGRLDQSELMTILDDDLNSLVTMLGNKKFFFGSSASDVTEFDCAIFGQLCQLAWQTPGCDVEETIANKYPTLVTFCENMKSAFWPDWDQRLLRNVKKSDVYHTQSVDGATDSCVNNSGLKESNKLPVSRDNEARRHDVTSSLTSRLVKVNASHMTSAMSAEP